MLAKFFIDRPIFATVLSVIITLTGAIALGNLPVAQYPRISPPGISISISYPGASSQVVADTVAAPIEQQVTGVPGMLYMSSQMGNDGSYSLGVTFDVSVDINTALVMVQNRVALALPLLPSTVQSQGITVRKRTPDNLCMVNFLSPDGSHDDLYLSNYALINVKDELLRVDGVSDVNIMGERDYSVRIWLDPQQLASRNMTALDVSNAVRAQNVEAAAGQLAQAPADMGQAFQLPISALGRLATPEQFGDIVIKVAQTQPAISSRGPTATSPGSYGVQPPPPVPVPGGLTDTSGSGSTSSGATSTSTDSSQASIGSPAPNIITGMASPSSGLISAVGNKTTGLQTASLSILSAPKRVGAGTRAGVDSAPPAPSVSFVRLRDVARIEMGAKNYNTTCLFDGKPAVGLNVFQLPGTNALDVGDRVRAKMKELQKRFPAGVDYLIAYDTTPFIRESIDEVFHTLRDAVILVALVVLLFLQDWRAMILPMIDIPVSLIGTFAVMAVMGYSLNNISLFGLVLAIGIVVDDSIVVLENIERQMTRGLEPRAATIKAMEEISGPILAITLVLCAVFVPCAFISGITGRFMRQFALTVAASTVISAINALTMTPSRALLIFKSKEGVTGHKHQPEALPWWSFGLLGGWLALRWGPLLTEHFGLVPPMDSLELSQLEQWAISAGYFLPGLFVGLAVGWAVIGPVNAVLGAFFRGFNQLFDRMTLFYGSAIGRALRFSAVVLIAYGGLLVLTYFVFKRTPAGFVPTQDQGRLIVSVQLPASAALPRTQQAVAQVDEIIRRVDGVAHTVGMCGISFAEGASGPNFASLFVILKPFAERQKPGLRADAIMAKLRKLWAKEVKDATVIVLGSSPIPGVSAAGGFKLNVEDRGGLGLATLQDQTEKLISNLKAMKVNGEPALASVTTQFRSNTPQLYMDIDRAKVASLGVALNDVNQTLQIYLGSSTVNTFNEFGRYWQVRLQAEDRFRGRVDDINLLRVRNNLGQMVSLGTLVNVREMSGPIFLKRYNLAVSAPVSGAIVPGVSTGDVIDGVTEIANDTLPRSMKIEWTELMYMQIKEGNTTGIVFALAVLCVFLALSALYESWTLPLAVILVVPLCILCSLTGVLYTNTSLNIFVQIGLVVLVGLACKNAILVVEFAKQLHVEGQSVYDATKQASQMRLRPILMTSFAFILGVLPLVTAHGAGAEMRRSLGIAVFSGMLGVTMFGIFLTPVFFAVIQGIGEKRLFASNVTRWIVSCALGAGLGLASGYLLSKLGVVSALVAIPLGGVAGVLAVAGVLGVHKTLRTIKVTDVQPGTNGHISSDAVREGLPPIKDDA